MGRSTRGGDSSLWIFSINVLLFSLNDKYSYMSISFPCAFSQRHYALTATHLDLKAAFRIRSRCDLRLTTYTAKPHFLTCTMKPPFASPSQSYLSMKLSVILYCYTEANSYSVHQGPIPYPIIMFKILKTKTSFLTLISLVSTLLTFYHNPTPGYIQAKAEAGLK